MIEFLEGFPPNVIALVAKGRVTKSDYDHVLTPKVADVIGRGGKVRCYYELDQQFSGFDAGAVLEDFKLGVSHLFSWERVAVVTDVEWIRMTVAVFRFLIPGEIRIFGIAEAAAARTWIVAS